MCLNIVTKRETLSYKSDIELKSIKISHGWTQIPDRSESILRERQSGFVYSLCQRGTHNHLLGSRAQKS